MNILFVYYYPSGGVETLAEKVRLNKTWNEFSFFLFRRAPGLLNNRENPTFITNNNREIHEIICIDTDLFHIKECLFVGISYYWLGRESRRL